MSYTKPEVQNNITCSSCKGYSGYKNSDISQFRAASEDKRLNCKSCGNVAIVIKGKNPLIDLDNIKHII